METISKKRRVISLEEKKEIIEASEGKSSRDLSKQFKIAQSTIMGILKEKASTLNVIDEGGEAKRAHLKAAKHEDLEEALLRWVKSVRSQNVAVTGSLVMPCDQGIIENVKVHYRRFLLRERISAIDDDRQYKINLLHALQFLRRSWDAVKPETLSRCFRKAGFVISEEAQGIYIEWKPSDVEDDVEEWVIEGGTPPERARRNSAHVFSVDIKEIRSYTYNAPKIGNAWVRFICKDGCSSNILHFHGGGYAAFVNCLQRYAFLSRSAKEHNLVLLVDNRTDALEKSVGMLNLDKDIFSRFIANPYATSLTALSKVTSIMAPLLDSESMINENQIRAMRKLEQTEEESTKLRSHNEAGFEHVFQLELPHRPEILNRETAVNEAVWSKFRAKDGRISDSYSLKSLIFRGGLVSSLRPIAWKFMLGYYKWENSDEENKKLRKEKEDEYYRMKLQWMSISEDQERRFSDFRDRKALIDKDVARTDRSHPFFHRSQPANLQLLKDILMTYCMYDFDLGYVQGMSDFISPVLVTMENEVDTFWCFVGLMDRVHKNFEMDQLFIRKQLSNLKSLVELVNPKLANYLESHESDHMYFCFRWILVCFKREFNFDDTMYLWEVLWTEIPCQNFLLLFCVAILDGQVNMIIENKFGLTEILKHINNLSMKIDLEKTLRIAEAIYHQLAAVQDKLPRHICEILSFTVDDQQETI